MLALATLALTLGYTLPTGPRRAGAVAHVADRSHGVYMGVYERLYIGSKSQAKLGERWICQLEQLRLPPSPSLWIEPPRLLRLQL